MEYDEPDILKFVRERTSHEGETYVEGPVYLGQYRTWRVWTYGGGEYHAHYVIQNGDKPGLSFKRDYQAFAHWLTHAFDVSKIHTRRLEWFRNIIAASIVFSLLGITIWAIVAERIGTGPQDINYRWLVGALAASSIAYLMGDWVRRRPA